MYYLYGKKEYLLCAYRIIKTYYDEGGAGFYPINLPILVISSALEKEGMNAEYAKMREYFVRHAESLVQTGLHYPQHEVNYEQSIVALYGECHCPACQENFRKWLKNKYGTIEKLNEQYWSNFWSHRYQD